MATTMGPIGMVFKGAYDAAVEYKLLNVVTSGGNSYVYRALTAGTGKPLPVAPAVTTEYWAAIALKGEAVEMRLSGGYVQYRREGSDEAWANLLDAADITPTFAVGTVTTGAAGSAAAVEDVGEPGAIVLSLTIPRGDTGAKGDNTYLHIKWANVPAPTDAQISDVPGDYIGVYAGNSAAAPTTAASYAWVKIKGETGETGNTGAPGADGTDGTDGRGIASVVKTAGTGAAGTTDTYTITFTDNTTFAFNVYNGADGQGTGDMLAAVYDPIINGKALKPIRYTATIGITWSGSAAPYTQQITIAAILATDYPDVDIVQTGNETTDKPIRDAWGKVTRIVTGAGEITVYAEEALTTSIPIQLKVVR